MAVPKPGDPAPDFALSDQDENEVKLSDFKGQKLLIYFYPAADTPGCTKQSCAVRDSLEDFKSIEVAVVGISPNYPEAQKAFDEKYSLGFPLLCDIDHAVAEAYGVWGEQEIYGNKYMGIKRSSFLIDEDGKILQVWSPVSPGDTVPKAVEALT